MPKANITSVQGKVIAGVTISGSFATLHLETPKGRKAGQITIQTDQAFDGKGNRYEGEN